MSSISSHQHNVEKKGVAIVVFISISAVAFHDVRGEKLCRVAICCQNKNNGTHVLENPTNNAALLTQTTPLPFVSH